MKHSGWIALVMALAAPAGASAQQAATSQQEAATEIGVYINYSDGAKRFVGAGGKVIAEGRSYDELVAGLGARADETPGRKGNRDQWNAAVLNILSRQGWELVGCQWFERLDELVYTCHLKRAAEISKQ